VEGGGVSVLRTETQAKIEQSSSCLCPSGRTACNHPSEEDPAAHSLQSDCAPVEGNSPQETGAPPTGEGKKFLRPLPGRAIVEPTRCSAFNREDGVRCAAKTWDSVLQPLRVYRRGGV
jgi:hypothetical protein